MRLLVFIVASDYLESYSTDIRAYFHASNAILTLIKRHETHGSQTQFQELFTTFRWMTHASVACSAHAFPTAHGFPLNFVEPAANQRAFS